MQTVMTPDVLKTMSPDEMEDWRDSGEDYRRELTHAVMRDLSCPENWDMNGEYRSEFGGFFPVQIRFTPSHGNYHIAVCSPGAISPVWMVVFVPASGRPFSVIRTLSGYQLELVSHTVSLTARLDADGYSQASIISILAAGARHDPYASFPGTLLSGATRRDRGHCRGRSRGAVSTVFPYASAFFRRLTGRKRFTLKEIRLFAPVLSAQELRGSRDSWLRAIDALIESRGGCCWLPLPVNAGVRLFPRKRTGIPNGRAVRKRCRPKNTPASAGRNPACVNETKPF